MVAARAAMAISARPAAIRSASRANNRADNRANNRPPNRATDSAARLARLTEPAWAEDLERKLGQIQADPEAHGVAVVKIQEEGTAAPRAAVPGV